MDLLDEIRAEALSTGYACRAAEFIATLTPEQRDAVDRARAERVTPAAISRWLVKRGYLFTVDSATRHLAGRCKCPTF